MLDKPKQIKLYKSLGTILMDRGRWFLWKAFHIKITRTITKEELKNFLVGLGIDRYKIYCADGKYYTVDWEVMKDILKHQWVKRKKYIDDRYDCDNYADSVSNYLAEVFDINSGGKAKNIKVRVISTGKIIPHRANLLVVTEDGVLGAYVFEGQNGDWCRLEKNKPIVIGGWEYELSSFEFN